MIVSNSSPLIALGAIGRLELFRKCFKQVLIPPGVYGEISEKEESPEFISLQKGIREKWIEVEKIELLSTLKTDTLGQGEKEAISLAAKHKVVLIIDDDSAKAYAAIMGVESHGTLYLLILAVRRNIVSRKEVIEIVNLMMSKGFYISTDVYGWFLQEI